jgi:hypothetical protein
VRRVPAGVRLSVEVTVPAPGEVVLEPSGLRVSADPLTPGRFELLAEPAGRCELIFVPVRGEERRVGRLLFTTS